MPAFGEILEKDEISAVTNYVMSLSGEPQDASRSRPGRPFSRITALRATAMRVWVIEIKARPTWRMQYGSMAAITTPFCETVTNSRFGVMPPWSDRLSEAEIRAVSAYVHQLGGGE